MFGWVLNRDAQRSKLDRWVKRELVSAEKWGEQGTDGYFENGVQGFASRDRRSALFSIQALLEAEPRLSVPEIRAEILSWTKDVDDPDSDPMNVKKGTWRSALTVLKEKGENLPEL